MILCWSAKGGSGTTVVAATLALAGHEATLVDLAGDAAVALGMPEPLGPGLAEWMVSPSADAAALRTLRVPVADRLQLVPRGREPFDTTQWQRAVHAIATLPGVVVDAGTGPPHEALQADATQSLLVIRPCFLALRRAIATQARPTGIVLVTEPGRALGSRDIEHALGVPVVCEVPIDPAVARAVDAGLLATRTPRTLHHHLRRVA